MAADQPSQKQGKTTAAGATSPNATKKPKERVPVKSTELTEINQYLMCSLCSGYLIDATAIIECQHTFCKSCILKYLETNGYCPICDIELNTVKPHLSLRSDVIVQRLVYKLVPGLLVSELRRRREHAESKNVLRAAEVVSETMALEVEAATDLSTVLSLDDVVSLSIEYFRGSTDGGEDLKPKPQPVQQKQDKLHSTTNVHHPIEDVNCSKDSTDANDRRYLKCPAAVSVGLLKKFIRMKYGLSDYNYRVDLLYSGNRDNSLENDLTLLDVAFIWNKGEPMRFHYRIFDRTVKSLTTRAGTKRSASSMMDEPPDDDAASGPQNRQPNLTNPSSKMSRVSNNSSTGANNSGGRTGGSARTTSTRSPATPVYDFSEGNSDSEEPILQTGKLKLRGFRRQAVNTVIASESCKSSGTSNLSSKRSPTNLRSSVEVGRRSSGGGKNASPARSNSIGTGGSDDHSEDADSDSSTESDEAKTTELTSSRVRSAAQTVLASQVNGTIKLKMSSEKREPLKLSLGSVIAKSPEHKHKHKHHHKMKHKKKHKPLKISLSLNPNSNSQATTTATSNNRGNVNQSTNNHKPTGTSVKASSGEKGTKLILGLGQNKNAEGKGNGPSGSANSQSNFPVNVKPTTSAHLSNISKSISVSIGVGNNSSATTGTGNAHANQLTKKILTSTSLVSKKNSEVQPSTLSHNNANSSSNPNQSSVARSHPLLPDSVHVPKSVTLIPVSIGGSNSSAGRGGISSGNIPEKSGSSSSSNSTSNRLNAHTITHPITNKSLHQISKAITVTEVPPPSTSGNSSPASSSGGTGGSVGSANNSGNNSNNTGSATAPSSNPIEKVIASAANKPLFSMEITKIYSNSYSNSKENPTKKLKERKGLDISITVPGMNIKDKNKTDKLEETLRQKMGLNSSPTTMTMNNKIKGSSGTTTGPFNAKMPPGITIGPAGVNKQSIAGNSSSTSSGSTIPGLGFTLPPHITAHPQHPPKQHIVVNQLKQVKDSKPTSKTSSGDKSKNSSGAKIAPQQMGGNKTKDSTVSAGTIPRGIQTNKAFENRKQLGEALASMIDMANRNSLKSPSPPKNCQQTKEQHKAGVKLNQAGNSCEKRALDMSSSSRKNSRESPELKRAKTNESSSSSGSNPKTSANEPLDLSGRTSRPNSNSSSPIHHHSVKATHHSGSSPNSQEKMKHNEQPTGAKKVPTPVPKVSPPTTTPTGFPSPSGKTSNKGSTPTGSSPSISSIVQNLTQKQLNQQQQQQKEQFLHNQIMHLQQGLHNMHATTATSNQAGGNGSHSHQGKGVSGGSLLGNSLSPKGSATAASMGLNSLSPPIIPMSNPSPPNSGFDPLRNLLTLSDAAVAAHRHGKVHPHPMNNLMAAVGLCPPPHTHNHTHHPGLSLPSPTSATSTSLFPHLVNSLGGGKSPSGMLDPSSAHAYLAAISAHNERLAAAAAGMGHFHGDSMSPPMSMGNSFFSQVARPPPSSSHNSPHGGLRIPSSSSIPPKSSSGGSGINNGKNKQQGSSTPPLPFSHPPAAPRSPNKAPSSSAAVSSSSSSTHSKSHDSSSSMKATRINGTTSSFSNNHLPIFPPGIHNPLYSRSMTTTNLVSSSTTSQIPISSATTTTTGSINKVANSDKKGIPNSMKISNFLPNKPKDGKVPDSSNVEATITSGSNVGGGTSLTKFLNSIPPLIVSQSQPNLSVSSATTFPKDAVRGQGTLCNKSNNECLSSKSKISPDSKTHSNVSSSFMHNPIKVEAVEKPIIASIIPLKSNADPITCQTSHAYTPKASLKLNEEMAKSNSSDLKSEGATTLMSSSSKGGSSFCLGLSPPAARTTNAQPQNQSVRNIPNPGLLFNRQNSSSNNVPVSSPVTSPTNSELPNSGKSLPFNFSPKFPLKEHGLAAALPFPGVSVPVQVKVDNDALPIPIPTLVDGDVKPKLMLVEQLENYIPKSVTVPITEMLIATEQIATSSSCSVTESNLLIGQPPNKDVDNIVTSKPAATSENKTTNQICKAEEIVKIEYTAEDADLDIDVGIETAPIFPTNDTTSHVNDENAEEKTLPCTEIHVESAEQSQSSSLSEQDIPSSSLSANEIKICHIDKIFTVEKSQSNQTEEADPKVSTSIVMMCHDTIETPSTIAELQHAACLIPTSPPKEDIMEIESTLQATEVVDVRQDETIPKVDDEVETSLNGESEMPDSTPMELPQQEDKKVELEQQLKVLIELKSAAEQEQEKSGEIPEENVEMSECDTGTNQVETFQLQLVSSNKNDELQIEAMECEEVEGDHGMEIQEIDHEVIPMSVDEPYTDEKVNIEKATPTINEYQDERETTHELEERQSPVIIINSTVATEIQVVQQESCNATITTTPSEDMKNNEAESSNEHDKNTSQYHTLNSDFQIHVEDLNAKSNSNLNQININPELVAVVDTNIMKKSQAETANETSHIENEATQSQVVEVILTSPTNNGQKDLEDEEEKLMESSSASLLELNCPSADTNDIELSNPVTIAAHADETLPTSSSTVPVVHVVKTTTEDMDEALDFEKCIHIQNAELAVTADTGVTSTIDVVEEPSLLAGVEDKVEDICQNTSPVSKEIDDKNTITPEPPTENVEAVDVDSDPHLTCSVPDSDLSSSHFEDADVEMTDCQQVELSEPEPPLSPAPVTFSMNEELSSEISVALISATATITTTKAEVSSNVMEVSSIESPISSRNSLESPTSPEDDIKLRTEALEQVAAGLFSTAANNMNNNNNKAINAPNCEIAITTTSASDMATV